jgi:hypothetical protein
MMADRTQAALWRDPSGNFELALFKDTYQVSERVVGQDALQYRRESGIFACSGSEIDCRSNVVYTSRSPIGYTYGSGWKDSASALPPSDFVEVQSEEGKPRTIPVKWMSNKPMIALDGHLLTLVN